MNATIVAQATPHGRGGIGIIRLSGSEALPLAARLTHRSREYFVPRQATYCTWYDDASAMDAGLVLYFPAPHSYTGEDVVEIQGHGSPVLLQKTLSVLIALGAKAAEPGEFTRRAVEHGKMDLSQAEAVVACIDAQTVRAAKQAQRHLDGDFGVHLHQIMDALLSIVAHIEACLDFPDEDIPDMFLQQQKTAMQDRVLTPLNDYLKTSSFGERLFQGASVAILGAPNVGKSSLLNYLAHRDRAIVSDIPGTTRDVLEIDFEIDGIPVRLVDTAGLRETQDVVEREGIRRATQAAQLADVVIFVADATAPDTWNTGDIQPDLFLMNKVDSISVDIPDGFVPVSVKHGVGMTDFVALLGQRLSADEASVEGLYITTARHRQSMEKAREHLLEGMRFLDEETSLDLLALEWRSAWSVLGEILGVGDVEHILDHIFSEFCIGK